MKNIRENTKQIKIGDIYIGGTNNVLIQSMCDIKTSEIQLVIKEINEAKKYGADLMRVSILDELDAISLKEIKKSTSLAIVADIHFSKKLALLAIESGADKIRINPGNLNKNDLDEIILKAKEHNIPIRIGVNEGSLSKKYENSCLSRSEKMVESCLEYVKYFENKNFGNLILSLKSSDPLITIDAYREISKKTNYPLHIGVTESGFDEIGIIRSVSALSPLLLDGIGNTIRISLTNDPIKEVKTARRLLNDLKIRNDLFTFISCPTCGRCMVNLKPLCIKINNYLENIDKNITVAIMGCIVNGIGEGKNADLGVAGGNKEFLIFKKGKIIKTVTEKDVYKEFIHQIDIFE